MMNIYTEKEIKVMRDGGKILAKILKQVAKKVKPGITTEYLNKVAEDLILKYKAKSSFKGFDNYPAVLCTSINEEIVHGVPSKKILRDGDILSLDLGIRYKGYCTDSAVTVSVGKTNKMAQKLINVTKKALELAIKQCKPDNHSEDIGCAIQNYVEENKFNVIRDLVGHGVGKNVHEDPQILNYGQKGKGIELKEGMVLALEPMTSINNYEIEKCEDGFGYRTKDRSLSAHFEHTVAITKKGPKNLTKI
ncbi:MAG: type I methionyl aminopeptidase [Candidatus Portnoybacteria bacterium RBG_13_40_8]|uniref:Methionine aminopeptidase n=1 Tax=Candidatus Portnoybacteria bacterium RBG_13_40_8 TaxID=1801990 RepID=A0A1G2F4W0_9BACT|nr:MAG: type I methionyl aminopeptidase [Candidatus Portnoybacteria bacterium RBG_13_40_8]OGZ34890.1 MAG: type I methionyl aminopeptidase [Candidatus Portnoybacteria bacterium RIFCSPHIGHO2_01_FULL_39_19]